ncbi:hypothetical protein BDN67DRAFT_281418 [Paxillus ammoniavirescens]|nr:hypothetical protein BDN67DRAFT_281418 [Paxillus ammoniavirescens]
MDCFLNVPWMEGRFIFKGHNASMQVEMTQVAGAAALFYDYLLGFGSEVDLIWTQKWNLVTLLYAVVRYLSFPLLINSALYMGSVNWTGQVSLLWYQIRMWGPYVYRIAMDVILIKRIRALSLSPGPFVNASKWVLIVMVFSCIAKWASAITLLMLGIGPGRHLTSAEWEFAGTFICATMIPNSGFLMSANIPKFCFELLLFILAAGYFVADVWEHYQREKIWKVNDFVQILARDSTIYFALNAAATGLNIGNWKASAPGIYVALSMSLQSFIPFCLSPRLVINVKQHANRVHMSVFERDLLNNDIPQVQDIYVLETPSLGSQNSSFA